MKTCYTREQIESTVKLKGYKWFEDHNEKGYDVNIVGVRNSETKNKVTNKFDDCITVSYKKDGEWKFFCFPCTTDPGTHWVENILNKRGVAILKPGQYRGSHKIRKHQNRYEALGQQKPMSVYRDKNLDGIYDLNEETVREENIGINIHRATKFINKTSTQVDKWSAGCQVIASNEHWTTFMKIMRKARDVWGNNFSYTLIESKDIV
jgi:hypothetical protein|tara:strand:- start:36 stop:656 length:621 start_codon:yes stop_codon:yes gene_type:complete